MRAAPRWILVISLLGASLLGVGSAQAAELDAAAVKARATLPACDLAIGISTQADDTRHVQLQAGTAAGQALLEAAC